MGSTFNANTLTTTGTIGMDTIDPTDQFFGFGNLIADGSGAINTVSAFHTKTAGLPGADYTKIKGQDVKLVHGDRWQELEAFMTENVNKDFVTTIGTPPTIMPKGATDPADLEYNDPKDDLNTKNPDGSPGPPITLGSDSGFGNPDDQANNAGGGLPPSSDAEKTQVDPGKGQARYILNVRGDQLTKIGGDVNLWVAGYNDTVQIGQCKASYFSQYITNTSDSHYHNIPDAYVDMNNDYKIVYKTKYRNVDTKQDIARISLGAVMGAKLEYKSIQVSGVLINLSASLASIGLRVIGNDTFGLHSLAVPVKAEIANKTKVAASVNACPSVQPCPLTG